MRNFWKQLRGLLRYPLPVLGWLALTDLPANDRWITGTVEEYTAYANTSKGMVKRVIEDFRELKAILAQMIPRMATNEPVPLRVFVVKDEATARRFLPASRKNTRNIGGAYIRDLEGDLIFLKGSFDSEIVRYAVYHEFMHFLVAASGYDLPTWLNEGLAELYSTVEISDRSATIGREAEWRSLVLDGENLIPLERLFEINEASPEYNNRKHGQGTFYAQSWGLVHYLTLGNTKVPRGAVWKLVDRILSERIVSEQAFKEITGLGFDQMERSLKRYIRAGSYRPIKMDRPKLSTDETLELSYASEGETDLIEGMLFLAMKRTNPNISPVSAERV